MGFTTRPMSCTATTRSTRTSPVPVSTATRAIGGHERAGGLDAGAEVLQADRDGCPGRPADPHLGVGGRAAAAPPELGRAPHPAPHAAVRPQPVAVGPPGQLGSAVVALQKP